jgi:hypothetical protein
MKKLLVLSVLTILTTSFTSDKETFIGKIVYKNSYADLQGNDMTEKVSSVFGREIHYFIDGKNYKAYDEKDNWIQLYNSGTNTYYHFNRDKTAMKLDGAMQTSQKIEVTKLDLREKIAGYDCQAIQIETDHSTTIYYYSPALKTDAKAFTKHNFGEWNKYLEATDGALTLKFIITNSKEGYVWTSVATEVVKQDLTATDFAFPSDVKLSN